MHIGCAPKALLSLTHTFFYNLESRAEADIVSAVDIVATYVSTTEVHSKRVVILTLRRRPLADRETFTRIVADCYV